VSDLEASNGYSKESNGVYSRFRKGVTKDSGQARWKLEAERAPSSFQVLLKPMLSYGKGRT
jgi:hypothetical protein